MYEELYTSTTTTLSTRRRKTDLIITTIFMHCSCNYIDQRCVGRQQYCDDELTLI
jgi:hypothetical protein